MRYMPALRSLTPDTSKKAFRRRYFIENMILERREVLALPTNLEQEMLAWVNRFRADPAGEFDRYISSTSPVQSPIPGVASAISAFGVNLSVLKSELAALTPQPPLAWNTHLNDAAYGHSQMMVAKDSQQHVLPGESDIGTRITNAGYTNWNTVGENIYAYATSVAYAQAGFIIDWGSGTDGMQSPRGHRNNLISGGFKELGISIIEENNPATQVGPLVVTQDFGNRFNRTNSSVLGEIFTDINSNQFYNAGEGNSGVNITLTGAAGTFTTTSWASGGYQFDNVPAGAYSLSIAGPGISTSYWTRSVTVGANNIESDFDLSQQPKSTVGFDSVTETEVKEGNSVVITLTRQGTISDALNVTVTPKDLASSTEIWQNLILPIANNGVVQFGPNQATATFTVQTITDNVIRADTHLNLQLTVNSNKYISGIATKPLFVLNDDGSVGFDSSADISLNEGSQTVVNVRRIGPTTDPLDVTVTPQDIAGSSETWQNLIQPLANNGVVHFDAGQSIVPVTINAISDNVIRADTKFNLKLTSASTNFPVSTDTRAITVLNNDQAVGFDNNLEAQVKAGGQVTLNLVRTGAVGAALDVVVTPQDIPGSTEIWQNLLQTLPGGGLVHFNAGQTQASLIVTAIQDGVLRADTHLNLVVSTTAANTNLLIDTKPLFVAHTVGGVGFESANEIQLKEGGLAVLNINRTGPVEVASDVDVQFVDQAGSTETWQNLLVPLSLNGRVHFNAGDTQASIVIQAIQDKVIRADTILNLKLTSASNIFSASTNTAPLTVFNDDGTVGFDNNTELPLREGGQLAVTLVRSGALTFPVDVKISPLNLGSGETWQNLIQPLANNGMIHFNAGQTQATVMVTALQDNLIKPDSRVTLQLTSTSSSILPGVNQKPLLVQNNNGVVGFDNATELTLNEGGQLQLNLVRSGAVGDAIDVTVKPVDLPGVAVMWQNLIQVLPNNGVVHFAAGQPQAGVTVQAIQDNIIRPDVHLNFQVTTSAPNWTSPAPSNLKPLVVVNDDTAIAFQDVTEIQLKEGTQVAVNIARSGNLSKPLNVTVAPTDLPGATQTWQNLILPLPNNGILHSDAGQAVASFMLTAIQDDIVRPDTRINLQLSTTDSSVANIAATRSVFVVNDDVDKPGTFQFAASSLNTQASEGAGKASMTITRTGGSLGQVIIPWTITQTAGPKLITVKPVDITFAAGQTSASIDIPLVNDKLAQPDQVFSVVLGTPKTAGAQLGTAKTASLTVLDNDRKPVFTKLAGKRTKQQITSLDAIFTDKLNATTAKQTSIWKVTEAGVDGLFGTTDDVLVAIKSTAYNATAKKITLTFATVSKSAKPLNYQVTLNGSTLQNAYNAPLGGVTTRTIKV